MATETNTQLAQHNRHIARTVRSLRQARGWSLGSLAERSGLSKTNLAKIEGGDGNPSLETLLRLADAFEITLGVLLGADRPAGTHVVRLSDAAFVRSQSGLQTRAIWSDGRNRRVETHELVLEPGVDYHSAPHPPGTEEVIVCLSGSLSVGPEDHEVELRERDAAHFPADVPHRYHSETGCTALCLMSYPAAS
ncbi:MAG TPA: XRE family transcriptional regulator [Micromonosporaceae bacterium]|nr:XRE family transcriptional regulator [Micromonosporaceae bacterium]